MGMLSGPKDFESTTQVEVASICLTDLGDPSQIFLSAPAPIATAPHLGTDGASSFSGKEPAHGAPRETGSLPAPPAAAPASTEKGDGKGKRVGTQEKQISEIQYTPIGNAIGGYSTLSDAWAEAQICAVPGHQLQSHVVKFSAS